MNRVNKVTFTKGLFWKVVNLFLSKGVAFIIGIILARKLEPESFGLMSVWTVLLALGNVFVIGGADTLLVQMKRLDKRDRNIAFTGCLCRAVFLYFILFYLAPYIADFYQTSLLEKLLHIAGIDFFSQCVITIFTADAMRVMDFKKLTIIEIGSVILSGVIAVLSISKFQDWALLINVILHRIFNALFLLLASKEKVYFSGNWRTIWSVTKNGIKIMLNNFCDIATGTMVGLFSMRKWTATDVGYVNRAEKITQTAGVETYNIISGLLLPTFSSYQEDNIRLKEITRKLIASSCYLMFPLMGGLALCSKEIVILLLTEKWLPIVPIIQIQCIYYALNPLRQLCMNLNYSVGNYERNTFVEFIRFMLTVIILFVLWIWDNISILMLSGAISLVSIVVSILYLNSLKSTIDYRIKEFVQDTIPIALVTVSSLFPGLLFKSLAWHPAVSISITVLVSVFLYIIISYLFRLKIFSYMLHSLLTLIRRKNEHTFID